MEYWIFIKGKGGNLIRYRDYFLDGIFPKHVIDMTECRYVDETLNLCRLCDVKGARCHVMIKDRESQYEESYIKYCPILFHDIIQPAWSVNDVV